jgi:hypothetical protein
MIGCGEIDDELEELEDIGMDTRVKTVEDVLLKNETA